MTCRAHRDGAAVQQGDDDVNHLLEKHPREVKHHDIFLVRKVEGQADDPVLDHFRIQKQGEREGFYLDSDGSPRDPVPFDDTFHRPVMTMAFPAGDDQPVGPVFSTLPVHPDPAASSACTCYLINTANVRYKTAFTAEEWNQAPGADDEDGNPGPDEFSLLLASPSGEIYYLRKGEGSKDTIQGPDFVFSRVDRKKNPELWTQLRNGCVVGRARCEEDAKVIPLVNVHSLL
jgi:hypothetical protein